jgi:acetyl-CoA carboxylase carboxyltransferase component
LAQIEASSLSQKEKSLMKPKKLNYSQKKRDTTNRFHPYYAASRLWTDAIIDPLDTRTWISMGIEAANHSLLKRNLI